MIILKLIVRCSTVDETIEIEVPCGYSIRKIIHTIKNHFDLHGDGYKLFHVGKELSPIKSTEYYNLQNKDVLILTKNNLTRSVFFSDNQSSIDDISQAEQWLSDNIVADIDEMKLISYKIHDDGRIIKYKKEDLRYKLKLCDGSVDEYDVYEDI